LEQGSIKVIFEIQGKAGPVEDGRAYEESRK